MAGLKNRFDRDGWLLFDHDPALAKWVDAIRPAALSAAADPTQQQAWLRSGGTWFVGVNALQNDGAGRVGNSPPLSGQAVDFINQNLTERPLPLDRAQISVCYAGYPKPSPEETEAAFAYRRNRDAAHVDGLHREGADNQRHLREFHHYLLGIPLGQTHPNAAPFVVWRGSHRIMAQAFADRLHGIPATHWPDEDLTQVYQAARRVVFETCERVELPAQAGQAYVVHRHALHGVAPWDATVSATDEGRMIAYFRPEKQDDPASWLTG